MEWRRIDKLLRNIGQQCVGVEEVEVLLRVRAPIGHAGELFEICLEMVENKCEMYLEREWNELREVWNELKLGTSIYRWMGGAKF